jgi:mono/diheme cytochrome c family protein
LVVLPVLAVVLALAMAACGGDDDGGESSGADLYSANCARCHGDEGQGGVGPELGGGAIADHMSLDEQLEIIRNGEGGMPAWEDELEPAEIEAVARFEREELGQ